MEPIKNFTLYFKGEPHEFKKLSDFTKLTGYSGAIALDMVLGRDNGVFKGWSNNDTRSH